MSSLDGFASLSLAELTAEITAMQKTFPPATAGTSRDVPEAPPLGRAGAGHFSTAARSGQVTPSPADTAARGDLLKESA
ncbi:hypothetical protein EAH88_11720 [Rhodanobacter glycinis]|uniref:Uncharacterized protein n=1 Tax=Rhodanobacter glycinis TaxID=582702 RepID=A0A502C452_9GAMM|nr:hypothetical protein [Rhodanobacter glycinis]TPG08295.1 hypothetical protein EAH88_11720 [Rhodanobacter glycinis]